MSGRDHSCPECGRGGINEPPCQDCARLRTELEKATPIARRACGPCEKPDCPHVGDNARLREQVAEVRAFLEQLIRCGGMHPAGFVGLAHDLLAKLKEG